MVGVDTTTRAATREGFGKGLLELGKTNSRVVVLSGDLSESNHVHHFAKEFPEKFIRMGVQEENMVGMAAGLALSGLHPFAVSYAAFNPINSLGPIRTSICYSKLPVVIVGGHSGFSASQDGATHQNLEDIATMRALPNMIVVIPADAHQAEQATIALGQHAGPAYLRIGKHPVQTCTTALPFKIGKAQWLKKTDGKTDITLIATGAMVSQALEVYDELQDEDLTVQVLNLHTIKPLDTECLDDVFARSKIVLTLEEHQAAGGMGSAVAEYLSQTNKHRPQFKIIAVNDRFGQSGTVEELWDEYGLSVEAILHQIEILLDQKE